jgi:hypothetical protein
MNDWLEFTGLRMSVFARELHIDRSKGKTKMRPVSKTALHESAFKRSVEVEYAVNINI